MEEKYIVFGNFFTKIIAFIKSFVFSVHCGHNVIKGEVPICNKLFLYSILGQQHRCAQN